MEGNGPGKMFSPPVKCACIDKAHNYSSLYSHLFSLAWQISREWLVTFRSWVWLRICWPLLHGNRIPNGSLFQISFGRVGGKSMEIPHRFLTKLVLLENYVLEHLKGNYIKQKWSGKIHSSWFHCVNKDVSVWCWILNVIDNLSFTGYHLDTFSLNHLLVDFLSFSLLTTHITVDN